METRAAMWQYEWIFLVPMVAPLRVSQARLVPMENSEQFPSPGATQMEASGALEIVSSCPFKFSLNDGHPFQAFLEPPPSKQRTRKIISYSTFPVSYLYLCAAHPPIRALDDFDVLILLSLPMVIAEPTCCVAPTS